MSPSFLPSTVNIDSFEFINDINNVITYSFTHPSSKRIVSVPVWAYKHDNKFYIFGGRKSLKCKSIDAGYNKVSLVVVNNKQYPHPDGNTAYLSISGSVKIVDNKDIDEVLDIHVNLLEKYNENGEDWINKLLDKIKLKPDDVWLIEVKPEILYTYEG